MKSKSVLVFLLVSTSLASCAIPFFNDNKMMQAPRLASMKIGFDDRSNAKFDSRDNSAYVSFMLELEEPSRNEDVDQIKIINPNGGSWTLDRIALDAMWEPSRNRFAIWNRYFNSFPDSIPLGEYKVVISESGKSDAEYAMTAYNNNNPDENTGSVFSQFGADSPKFVAVPSTLTAEKSAGSFAISLSATGVSDKYYGFFIWLYDADNSPIGGYEVAWPFNESQIPDFSIEQVVTELEYNESTSIIVGFLAEDHLPDASQFMMYRYLSRINL